MSDQDLYGGIHGIGLEPAKVVGVMATEHMRTNQTRTTRFDPKYLLEWAKAVNEAYEREVEVVFTPERPMLAHESGADPTVGIGVAPRLSKEDVDDA